MHYLFLSVIQLYLTLYGHIKTAEQQTVQQYGDLYTGQLMGGPLHMVQQGGPWADCGPAQ